MGASTRISRHAIFIAEFVTLAAMSIAIVFLVERGQAAAARESNALEMQSRLVHVRHLLNRADGALRGFLLTGQEKILDDHLRQKRALSVALNEFLASRERDKDLRHASAAPLQSAVAELVEQWRRILAAYDVNAKRIPIDLIVNDQTALAQNARPIFDNFEDQHRALVETRTRASTAAQRYLLATAVAGSALVMGIAAASLLLMHRREEELRALQRQLETTNTNLETLVEQRAGHVREVNEELQRFAYIISHDLRAPLVNIMGFTSELEALRPSLIKTTDDKTSGEDSEEAGDVARDFDEALKFIKSSSAKMDRLINAVLQLSREGQRVLRPEPIDMTRLFQTISETLTHQAREADATITVAPVANLTSDRLALEQIFLNLVDNALKYLRPSVPGEVTLSATETPTTVIYRVKDNGRGVEEKDKDRIFDLFRRAGIPEQPGEGIGLAHTRALARRLGGSISVQSTPGVGSEFCVALPKLYPHSE